MAQLILPLFEEGVQLITPTLGYEKRDGVMYYFHGGLPLLRHDEDDLASFRAAVCQFVESGACSQMDIVRAFGIPAISVKRLLKKFRAEGPGGFYPRAVPARKPRVLTDEVIARAQDLADEGRSAREIAETLGLKADTVGKAFLAGRLRRAEKKTSRG